MAKGTHKPLVPKEIRSIRGINKKCGARVMRRVIWVAYLGEDQGDPSALANRRWSTRDTTDSVRGI